MRLGLAFAGVVAVGAVAVFAAQRLNDADRYRRMLSSGERALASGNTYAAVESLSGALALRPDSMTAHLRRGEAYLAQQRPDDAARDFREAARLQPGATDPLTALGGLHDSQGQPLEAAEWYARAAAIDRQSPSLLYRLALARYRGGQPGAAIDPLRQAIALDPGFEEAFFLLGGALRDTQDVAGAIDALERAVRANPELVAAREELADLYAGQRRAADEMAQLTALAGLTPSPGREVAIALAQARRGDYDSANATLDAAIAAAPSSLLDLARGRVAVLRAEAATTPADRIAWATRAAEDLERALGGTIRRADGLAYYGRALALRGDLEQAERLLREAVATTPFNRVAFLYLADAAEALKRPRDALDWLERFDVLEGDAGAPAQTRARRRRLGGLAVAAGDYATAVARLEPLAAAGEGDAEVLRWLAEAKWRGGDLEGGRTTLAAATALEPNAQQLRRLRQLIR